MCTAVQHKMRCATTELLMECLFLLYNNMRSGEEKYFQYLKDDIE